MSLHRSKVRTEDRIYNKEGKLESVHILDSSHSEFESRFMYKSEKEFRTRKRSKNTQIECD